MWQVLLYFKIKIIRVSYYYDKLYYINIMFISPEQIINSLNLKEGDIVADFGCGAGAYVFAASKFVGDRGKVYAIDRFTDMIDKINREAEKKSIINIDGIVADVEEKI